MLLREGPTPEVFLVRRHSNVAFMGGAHVFPGGSVEDGDRIQAPELICDGVESATARLVDVAADMAVAFHLAAVRELFEEAGVLLARRDGAPVAPADISHLLDYRRQLAAGASTIAAVAAREAIRLALDELVYFAHWVTPEREARRFDTRFFLAAAPPGQDATHDDAETTQGEWMTPAEAIARCRRGEIALPPPTWTTLRTLERFATVAEALAWARTRVVPRVQPGLVERNGATLVLLPGDPAYPPVAGFDAVERRFILEAGRWRPAEPD